MSNSVPIHGPETGIVIHGVHYASVELAAAAKVIKLDDTGLYEIVSNSGSNSDLPSGELPAGDGTTTIRTNS